MQIEEYREIGKLAICSADFDVEETKRAYLRGNIQGFAFYQPEPCGSVSAYIESVYDRLEGMFGVGPIYFLIQSNDPKYAAIVYEFYNVTGGVIVHKGMLTNFMDDELMSFEKNNNRDMTTEKIVDSNYVIYKKVKKVN